MSIDVLKTEQAFTEDNHQLTEALLEAASQHPLIQLSKIDTGVAVGGIALNYPIFLSDLYTLCTDIEAHLANFSTDNHDIN